MLARSLLTAVSLAGVSWMPQQPPSATIVVRYSVVSEDDASNNGSVTMLLKLGEVRGAIVWELDCHLSARANAGAAAPGVDQYWRFLTDLVAAPDRSYAVRVRSLRIRIAAAGPQPPEKEQLLPLDGTGTVAISDFSTRTDCRYDRINMSVAARGA